ncbi:MAG: response regulator transcription factor [Ignavibacteriae bacterium]|nr:response regulator transcription factor [Ignavibacteriota bacterium]
MFNQNSIAAEEVVTQSRSLSEAGLNVWVVEDETRFRNALVNVINHTSGLQCEHSFGSCEAMLENLNKDSPPDVILMDIVLPKMNGIEGVGRVKAVSPTTDVVILTNYADDDKIFKALCAGASGYLLKTTPHKEIKGAIREVVDGGAPMTAQIARKVLDTFAKLAVPRGEYSLTDREREVLRLLVDGLTKKKIAEKLFLSCFTVDTHLKNIYNKLHVHTISGAVAKVLKEHLV